MKTKRLGLTICRDELPHSRRNPTTALHELHLRNNYVVLQHRTTTRTDRISPSLVEVDLGATTVLAYSGSHVCCVIRNKTCIKRGYCHLCNVG
ncbi:hypothetical protein UPYG_G00253220 [Umbra pygmaea]|uniref:Uncharacterized protein n=1 Tax=Umbra pygmaea TaxID=75934 RepID=A0ABD0W7X7_UMBPY